MAEAFPLMHVGGNCALSFLACEQRGSLVVRKSDLGGRIGGEDSLANAIPLEKRQRHADTDAKLQSAIVAIADAEGLHADAAIEHESWKEMAAATPARAAAASTANSAAATSGRRRRSVMGSPMPSAAGRRQRIGNAQVRC